MTKRRFLANGNGAVVTSRLLPFPRLCICRCHKLPVQRFCPHCSHFGSTSKTLVLIHATPIPQILASTYLKRTSTSAICERSFRTLSRFIGDRHDFSFGVNHDGGTIRYHQEEGINSNNRSYSPSAYSLHRLPSTHNCWAGNPLHNNHVLNGGISAIRLDRKSSRRRRRNRVPQSRG